MGEHNEERKVSSFKGRLRKRGVSLHLTVPMEEVKVNRWRKGQMVEGEIREIEK